MRRAIWPWKSMCCAGGACIVAAGILAPGASSSSPATLAGLPPITVTGQIGGRSLVMAEDRGLMLLGAGARILAVDLGPSEGPVVVGRSAVLPGVVTALTVADGRAYALVEGAGLWVFGRHGTRVDTLGSLALPDPGGSLAVSGGFAALPARSAGLRIIDVRDPQRLAQLALLSLPTPSEPGDAPIDVRLVVAYGHLVGVVGEDPYAGDVLRLIDLTDPAAPRALPTFLRFDTQIQDLVGVGSYVYVLENLVGLTVLDLRRPAAPEAGRLAASGLYGRRLAVAKEHVFASTGSGNPTGLAVFDVRDPAQPTLAGTFLAANQAGISAIGVAGDRLAVAFRDGGALSMFDVSEPATPRQLPGMPAIGPASRVVARGRTAFAATADGLWSLGPDPTGAPMGLARIEPSWQPLGLALSGDSLVVAAGAAGLALVDVHDAASPRAAGRLAMTASDQARDVAADGALAYVAREPVAAPTPRAAAPVPGARSDTIADNRAPALVVVAIDDPDQPRAVAELALTAPIRLLVAAGGLAVGYQTALGLQVFDVSEPARPRLTGAVPLRGEPAGIALDRSGHAYVVAGHALSVFDLAVPDRPIQIATASLAAPAGGLALDGPTAYVLERPLPFGSDLSPEFVELFDVSDPAAPRNVGRIGTPADAMVPSSAMAATDGRVWVAAQAAGVVTLAGRVRHAVYLPVAWRAQATPMPESSVTAAFSAGQPSARATATLTRPK